MTWSVTERGFSGGNSVADTTDITIAAFTPAADTLLVVGILCNGAGQATGITGHGTWSQVAAVDNLFGTTYDLELWGCLVGGFPGSSTVVIDLGAYQSKIVCQCLEIDETAGFPATVSACFGTHQSVGGNFNFESQATSALSAFADSDNMTLCLIGKNEATAPSNEFDAEDSRTSLTEYGGDVYFATMCFHWGSTEDTTPSVFYNGKADQGHLGIEVKRSSIPVITSVSSDDTIGPSEDPWNITGTGFGDD